MLEYVVVVLRHVLSDGLSYRMGRIKLSVDTDGIFRSRVFPGLWLHVNALLQRDGATVMDVLRQGLATPEHAAFVQRLQGNVALD